MNDWDFFAEYGFAGGAAAAAYYINNCNTNKKSEYSEPPKPPNKDDWRFIGCGIILFIINIILCLGILTISSFQGK